MNNTQSKCTLSDCFAHCGRNAVWDWGNFPSSAQEACYHLSWKSFSNTLKVSLHAGAIVLFLSSVTSTPCRKRALLCLARGFKVLPEDQASAISEYRYYASLKAFCIHIRCDNQILHHRINAAWMHRLISSREWIFSAFRIIKLSVMDRFTKPFFFFIQFSTSLFYFCNMLHFWKRFGVFLYRSFWTILLFLRIIFYFRSFPCHGPIPN